MGPGLYLSKEVSSYCRIILTYLRKKKVKIDDFYMDETLVTNHQYVEFLNQILNRIKVEGNIVKGDGKIWLFFRRSIGRI